MPWIKFTLFRTRRQQMSVDSENLKGINDVSSNKHGDNRRRHMAAFGIAAFVVLAIGAAGGAGAMKIARPSAQLAPLTPTAINSLKNGWNVVTVKGEVAEIFGNKFVVKDDTGRALIETGPSGDDGKLVALIEKVDVQGRFDKGFFHASYIVHADGRTEMIGPPGPPPPRGSFIADAWRHTRP
jgi:uncharacterized protein YdeI (BOF family)